MTAPYRIGIIGARGYVGAELLQLLECHGAIQVVLAGSRAHAGQRLCDVFPGRASTLVCEELTPLVIAERGLDALILALPNGLAAPYVAAIDQIAATTVIVDLSADYRFDARWYYGLPELTRSRADGHNRISNPGCFATAMQLALAPVKDLLTAPTQCFGVSGYSGAGSHPSDRNDPAKLHDNLLPYALIGHLHEREVSQQLGFPVEFMPHVAAYFRGITLTANLHFATAQSHHELSLRYQQAYAGEPLLRWSEQAPWVSEIAHQQHAEIGGLTVSADGRRAVVVVTLDNLLKGAATQALQNLNRALGCPELQGIR
ncbi:MAG: N-acetyl-gamma-glutamyl-phosphate reductase [Lysobacterales bacterium CG02_land_8_20_14_3_00_62_12]|nr:MAG: N-acetyl-gamma-glutamyl-phosphate reductase [Xanthomonadales bacterium CG02_land_8_20_14_3_00_62_12]